MRGGDFRTRHVGTHPGVASMSDTQRKTAQEGIETMTATRILTATMLMLVAASAAFAQVDVRISEIRIDQPSTDVDEYVELAGTPGASLDGLTYIVIGDGSNACGQIENVTDLTGQQIQADGFLSIGDSGTSGQHVFSYDVELDLNFENSDNVTHMIVSGFTGANGDDTDVDDDCVMDNMPWAAIIDDVALWEGTQPECSGSDECWYSSTVVGPDGSFVPGHVYLCPEGWLIGQFDPTGGSDTPGEANDCPVPVEPSTWGKVKSFYND
jgi:hypothetical protein